MVDVLWPADLDLPTAETVLGGATDASCPLPSDDHLAVVHGRDLVGVIAEDQGVMVRHDGVSQLIEGEVLMSISEPHIGRIAVSANIPAIAGSVVFLSVNLLTLYVPSPAASTCALKGPPACTGWALARNGVAGRLPSAASSLPKVNCPLSPCPDVWAAAHPDHIREYRQEERRDRADRKQYRRAVRRQANRRSTS